MWALSTVNRARSKLRWKSESIKCFSRESKNLIVFGRYENTHAFATSLGGSDNIIMFHTKRYGARPLIVQGAGAGAAVTAMGVLSDCWKLVV